MYPQVFSSYHRWIHRCQFNPVLVTQTQRGCQGLQLIRLVLSLFCGLVGLAGS